MPPVRKPKASSTARRKDLGEFINLFGDIMPKACSNCRVSGKECRVHVRSGRCGACHLSGAVCDVRVTRSEWERLKSERQRILREIELSRKAQEEAFQKELRLRREMVELERQAEEAIAVEEANIEVQERQEFLETTNLPTDPLALSPHTWSASDGLADQFWAPSLSTPWVTLEERRP